MIRRKNVAIIHCDGPKERIFSRGKRKNLEIWHLTEDVILKSNAVGKTNIIPHIHFPVLDDKDFPCIEGVDGVIIPGSIFNTDPESIEKLRWLKRLMKFIRRIHEAKKPLLGMCFGHQAIGSAFDVPSFRLEGKVGAEVGFHRVDLTDEGSADPLFEGFNGHLMGIFFHYYYLPALPKGSVHLARNSNCLVQAFRIGDTTWGVQFHPDYDVSDIRMLAELRRDDLRKILQGRGIELDHDDSGNQRVLQNFLEIVQST
jgi:GMP synthase (glutamine-hydrolysing)